MKRKFAVDIFRTIAQTIEVEAETEEEAIEIACEKAYEVKWSIDGMLTSDIDVEISGECDENGKMQYN